MALHMECLQSFVDIGRKGINHVSASHNRTDMTTAWQTRIFVRMDRCLYFLLLVSEDMTEDARPMCPLMPVTLKTISIRRRSSQNTSTNKYLNITYLC